MIREFFEHHELENTKSVFQPESSLDGKSKLSKNVLGMKTGLPKQDRTKPPILVQMLQAMKADLPQADIDTSEPEDDESIDTHRLTTQFDHVEDVR